jgi:glycolate oxidase
MEMLDQEIIRIVEPRIHAGYPLDAGAVLLIEVEGVADGVLEDSAVVEEACRDAGAREVRSADEAAERERLWEGRKAAIGAIGGAAPAFYLLDGVVPRTKLPEVMTRVQELCREYGFGCANVFHAGDGNLHPNIMFDPTVSGATERVLDLGGAIMRACVDAGGSITGEHGIGLEKRSYMEWVFSEDDLEAQRAVREAFGPSDRFNPCKVLPGGHGCASGHASEVTAYLNATGAGAYV